MNLLRADLFRYRLPPVEPLRFAFGTLHEREGLLLRLQNQDGLEGWGEAAPLPGFSPDTLEDSLAEASSFLEGVRAGGDATPRAPSLAHALRAARADLAARREGLRFDRWLARCIGGIPAERVAVQRLLVGDDAAVLTEAHEAREAGYLTFKLKVGNQPVEADVARVQAVAEVVGDEGRLRLDANRAWSTQEALAFAESVEGVPLDFLEEPLRVPDAEGYRQMRARGLRVALDESLDDRDGVTEPPPGMTVAEVVVLKPALGRDHLFVERWRKAGGGGAQFVVSSAFESGVGTRYSLALAAALGGGAAGLDPYRRFAEDVLVERLPLSSPIVAVADALALQTVNLDKLERVR